MASDHSSASSSSPASPAAPASSAAPAAAASADVKADDTVECCVCLEPVNIPFKLPACGHMFCYLCIKGVLQESDKGLVEQVCPLCRAKIDKKDLARAKMLRNDYETHAKQLGIQYQWKYAGKNGWWLYDVATNQQLEDFYQQFLADGPPPADAPFTIRIGAENYIVDFTNMFQMHATQHHKKRAIQRDLKEEVFDKAPVKGQAGVTFMRTASSNHYA